MIPIQARSLRTIFAGATCGALLGVALTAVGLTAQEGGDMLRDLVAFGLSFPAGTLLMLAGGAIPGGGWVAAPLALAANGAFVVWLARMLRGRAGRAREGFPERPI